jgi:hypothetical protein
VAPAAARRTTIDTTCADLSGAPDANTVRGYLTEQLPPTAIPELKQQWNSLLRALIPDWLRARPQEVALDFHDEPYSQEQKDRATENTENTEGRDQNSVSSVFSVAQVMCSLL